MKNSQINVALILINDLSNFKLPTKAMTEKLLLRSHYRKPISELQAALQDIDTDDKADDEAKKNARQAKWDEDVKNFNPRYFTKEAFEQIVDAATQKATVESMLAAQPDENGAFKPVEIPTEMWLSEFVEALVSA